MDRKEFLGAMLALGGVAMHSSAASAVLAELDELEKLSRKAKGRIDQSKCIIMADIHICGEFDAEGKPKYYANNPISFNQQVRAILSMRQLPANLIILGDIAYDYGHEADYRYVRELFRPLENAGIKITVAMGNHDRRHTFFNAFPEYAEQTKVEGRVVSVVELPGVDFIVLDTLNQLPDNSSKVAGTIDQAQLEWLGDYLSKSNRPAILSGHHPMTELSGFEQFVTKHSQSIVAYIYGHVHIWNKGVRIIRPIVPQRMLPTIAIPSTFYGDIGYAVMECDKEGATINYSSSGFWWPQPVENPPKEWLQRVEDLKSERCRILFR